MNYYSWDIYFKSGILHRISASKEKNGFFTLDINSYSKDGYYQAGNSRKIYDQSKEDIDMMIEYLEMSDRVNKIKRLS